VGWGVNIFGLTSVGIIQYFVIGTSPTIVGCFACSFSHFPKSTVPGNGVIITNWANVTPAFSAISTVASKVAGLSVGRPKMNEPSTCTPCFLNVCNCFASASPE
jgi:hypothetical protein